MTPDLVVGDADSLGPDGLAAVRAAGIPVELAAVAKDESDLELAVAAALARGATRLTILGGLGGARFDHALANAFLLAHPTLVGLAAVLLDATTRVRLLDASAAPAEARLAGAAGRPRLALPDRRRRHRRHHGWPCLSAARRAARERSCARPLKRAHRSRGACRAAGRPPADRRDPPARRHPVSSASPAVPAVPDTHWRTRDIVVTAVIGVAFGVVFWAWGLAWAPIEAALGPAALPALRGLADPRRPRPAHRAQARRRALRRDAGGRRRHADRQPVGPRHAPLRLRPGGRGRARLRVHPLPGLVVPGARPRGGGLGRGGVGPRLGALLPGASTSGP